MFIHVVSYFIHSYLPYLPPLHHHSIRIVFICDGTIHYRREWRMESEELSSNMFKSCFISISLGTGQLLFRMLLTTHFFSFVFLMPFSYCSLSRVSSLKFVWDFWTPLLFFSVSSFLLDFYYYQPDVYCCRRCCCCCYYCSWHSVGFISENVKKFPGKEMKKPKRRTKVDRMPLDH